MARKRKRYTDDFRASAVLMLEAAGYPDTPGASIYGIYKVGSDVPFYIGSTRYDKERRFYNHISLVKNEAHQNKHFSNKVKKIGIDNVEVRLIHSVENAQQFFAEKELIEWALDCDIKLTNRIYNGISWDIDDSRMEYEEHPGMTPDMIEHLSKIKGPPNIWWNKANHNVATLLWDSILLMASKMLENYEREVRIEYPGFLEWYEDYLLTNG